MCVRAIETLAANQLVEEVADSRRERDENRGSRLGRAVAAHALGDGLDGRARSFVKVFAAATLAVQVIVALLAAVAARACCDKMVHTLEVEVPRFEECGLGASVEQWSRA
jgi:hypothetical protein